MINSKYKIIIIEDDFPQNRLICNKLIKAGFDVESYYNGKDVINTINKITNEIFIIDYNLPDIKADELISTLKQIDSNLSFIIITSISEEEIIIEMMKMGAIDFIIKDIDFLDLLPNKLSRIIIDITQKREIEAQKKIIDEANKKLQNVTVFFTDFTLNYLLFKDFSIKLNYQVNEINNGKNKEYLQFIRLLKDDTHKQSKEDLENLYKLRVSLLKGNEHVTEFKIFDKNNKHIWYRAYLTSQKVEGEEYVNVFGAYKNITKEKLKYEEECKLEKLENVISNISQLFISSDFKSFNTSVNIAISILGNFAKSDRVYIFEYFENFTKFSNTYEWCSDEIEPQIDGLKNLNTSDFDWWNKQIFNNNNILIDDINSLPLEAKNEKSILELQQIKSLIVFPIKVNKTIFGFIGFDSVKVYKNWTEFDISTLKAISNILSNVFENYNLNTRLYKSEKRFKRIFENSPIAKIVLEVENKDQIIIRDINNRAIKKFKINVLNLNKSFSTLDKYFSISLLTQKVLKVNSNSISEYLYNQQINNLIFDINIYKIEKNLLAIIFQDRSEEFKILNDKITTMSLPDESPNEVFRLSLDGKILYHNKNCYDLFKFWKIGKNLILPQKLLSEFNLHTKNDFKNEYKIHDKWIELLFKKIEEKKCYNVYGRDITKEKNREISLLSEISTVKLISNSLAKIIACENEKQLFDTTSEIFYNLIPDAYIIVSRFNIEENVAKIKSIKGMDGFINRLNSILGFDIMENTYGIVKGTYNRMFYSELYLFEGGIYELSLNKISKLICKTIEKLLSINKIYTLGLVKDNFCYGSVLIILKNKNELLNQDTLKALAKIITQELDKLILKDELVKKGIELKANISEKVLVNQRLDEYVEAQEKLRDFIGYSFQIFSLKFVLDRIITELFEISWLNLKPSFCIFIKDIETEEFKMFLNININHEIEKKCNILTPGKCLCGEVINSKTKIIKERIDDKHEVKYNNMISHGHYVAPLMIGNKIIGVLNLYVEKNYVLKSNEIQFLDAVTDIIAKIVDTKQKEDKIADLNRNILIKNRELTELINVSTHDVRTPLVNMLEFSGIIINAVKKIQDEANNQLKSKEDICKNISKIVDEDIFISSEFINKNVIKMGVTISGIVELHQLSNYKLKTSTLNMNKIIELTKNKLSSLISDNYPKFIINKLHNFEGDEFLFVKIFTNIIENAIFYKKENLIPIIKIYSIRNESQTIYTIEDNGIGIDELSLRFIFDIYFQGNHRRTGMGLGLPFVKRAIELHKGEIKIESEKGNWTKIHLIFTA